MTAAAQAIRAAIDARPGTEEVCLALLEVLDAAERAATDPEALDAVIAASMALWDVPLTPDGARILAAINHLGFGNEPAAAAALADEGGSAMKLEEAVARACERLRAEGIEGWGLHMEGGAGLSHFDCVQVEPAYGCDSETCNHVSHDPIAPVYRFIPRRGTLVRIGADDDAAYYVLRLPEGDRYYGVEYPRHHHARLWATGATHIPEYLVAALAADARDRATREDLR